MFEFELSAGCGLQFALSTEMLYTTVWRTEVPYQDSRQRFVLCSSCCFFACRGSFPGRSGAPFAGKSAVLQPFARPLASEFAFEHRLQDRLQPNTGEATIVDGSVYQFVGRRVGLKTA